MLKSRVSHASTHIQTAICPASAYLNSFSLTSYFSSAAGAGGPDLLPGTTFVIIWFNNYPTTDSVFWNYSDGTSGWFLDQNGSQIYFNLRNPSTTLIPCGYPVLYGLNKLALTRTSTGSVKCSLNRNTVSTVSASPTYVTASSSAKEYIGRSNPSIGNYTSVKVFPIAFAYLTREATDQELLDWSDMSTNDVFHMHSRIISDGYLTQHTRAEDWSGSGSLVPIVGSSRVLTPTGTPTKTVLEQETVYTVPAWAYSDSVKSVIPQDRCTFARIIMESSTSKISGQLKDSIAAFGNYRELILFNSSNTLVDEMDNNQTAYPQFVDGYGLTSDYKRFNITEGLRTQTGSGPYYGNGFTCAKVRAPTSKPIRFIREQRQANRIVVVGDSISVGDRSTIPARDCWTTIARKNGCNITTAGWGTASFYSMAYNQSWLNSNAARIASLCDGYQDNVIWWALGTNDYGLSLWGGNTTNFANCCAAFWDAIHVLRPDVSMVAQLPILRSPDGTLGDFRTAEANATVGRDFMTVVDASAWNDITLYDGVHPNDAGYIVYEGRFRISYPKY